jgi:hypothetical protein
MGRCFRLAPSSSSLGFRPLTLQIFRPWDASFSFGPTSLRRYKIEELGYVHRMSSFFSTWAKSLSLVAREALRLAARAAAKQSE